MSSALRLLGLLALGDVERETGEEVGLAVVAGDEAPLVTHPSDHAVAALDAEFGLVVASRCYRGRPRLPDALPVVGVDLLQPLLDRRRGIDRGQSHDGVEAGVALADLGGEIAPPSSHARAPNACRNRSSLSRSRACRLLELGGALRARGARDPRRSSSSWRFLR